MSSSNLIRWSGLAAIGSGVLFVIAELLNLTLFVPFFVVSFAFSVFASPGFLIFQNALYLIGGMLLLLGLVGLYARQSEVAGLLGLAGFLVAFVGTVLVAGFVWYGAIIDPPVLSSSEFKELLNSGSGSPHGFFLPFKTLAVGWLLFGIASLRSRVYPRAAIILLIIGGAVLFIAPLFVNILFDVAVAWLGFALFTGRNMSAGQPARVS